MAIGTKRPRKLLSGLLGGVRSPISSVVSISMTLLLCTNAAWATGGMAYQGVNISGGEFNQKWVPGRYNWDYVYPEQSEIDFFHSKGMNCIRLCFSWDRLQPTENGALDSAELARIDNCVNMITAKGMSTILDPHNYGEYKTKHVGVSGGWPNSMFADFWARVAQKYKNNPKVIFGLQNEPIGGGMTSASWCASSQAAINAIRNTGATNLILVPSTHWMHPKNFLEVNASEMIKITDPGNNWSYDMHQYFDYDGSGTHTDTMSPSDGVATLSSFTAWCRQNGKTAFLSEFGVPKDSNALALLDAVLKYMHANKDVWTGYTYWTAGSWFPADYMFSVHPVGGRTTPQMQTLVNNLNATTPEPEPPPQNPPPQNPPPQNPPPQNPPPQEPPPQNPPPQNPPPQNPPPQQPPMFPGLPNLPGLPQLPWLPKPPTTPAPPSTPQPPSTPAPPSTPQLPKLPTLPNGSPIIKVLQQMGLIK
ncbi:MAG: macromolecule metabolism protein [Cyanobacteria bacterium PR.3.49]|nr:macromolecule metabolism protein [Cyanobacteria bacterium PR.3.49]